MKKLTLFLLLTFSFLAAGHTLAEDLPVGDQNVPLKLLDSAKTGNVLSGA